MLEWKQLNENLAKAAKDHQLLDSLFRNFADSVLTQINPKTSTNGITVSPTLGQDFFATKFAGRTLNFVFSSNTKPSGTLIGNVKCYLRKEFPEQKHIEIGEFTFNKDGQTNLIEPEDNDTIIINADSDALYVALHFIHESLSQ